jgi:hypothetical protein
MDLATLFNKAGEKAQSEAIKDKFHTFRGKGGLDVANINDDSVPFSMKVMACKLLRKCRKDEVFASIIAATKKCTEGVQLNLSTFLVNQFLTN